MLDAILRALESAWPEATLSLPPGRCVVWRTEVAKRGEKPLETCGPDRVASMANLLLRELPAEHPATLALWEAYRADTLAFLEDALPGSTGSRRRALRLVTGGR